MCRRAVAQRSVMRAHLFRTVSERIALERWLA
jgi:hypothetical protein